LRISGHRHIAEAIATAMLTSVQLFRYDQKLPTISATGEPSLTLVRNDSQFGLLLSSGVHEDRKISWLCLEEVSYLRIAGKEWVYTDFDFVTVFKHAAGVWVAQEPLSGRYFRNPSRCPYHVIFIAHEEYRRLRSYRREGLALPVFRAAQEHFGRLPGFSFNANILEAPDDYALRDDALSASEYLPEN
jgi:hypothetical protein